MMSKTYEYYPTEIVIKDIDPYAFKTTDDLFHALKRMRIGIISKISMYDERIDREKRLNAVVLFEKWDTANTRNMRKDFETGCSVDIPSVGHRAYMVDYPQRRFLKQKKEEEEEKRRIRKQKKEEEEQRRRIRKQKEEEEEKRRIRKQKKEEEEQRRRIRKQKEKEEKEEQQRLNREEAERFEMDNQYVNDMQVMNDLEIEYGDEETKFFKFNRKTGKMDYKGRQYTVYE